MNKITIGCLSALLFLGACETKTPQGVKYNVVKKGDGRVAKEGEVVVMNVSIRDSKDSAWFDSYRYGIPEMVMIRHDSFKTTEYGIMELFRLVSTGDSVTMTVPAREFFESTWKQPVPAGVDPVSPFTFYVSTTHVLDSVTAIKMRDDFETKRREEYERAQAENSANQLGLDTAMIDEYLAAKKLTAQKTASGIRYIIKKKGRGSNAVAGQRVTMKYSGYLLSGEPFDSGVYPFTVGTREVIPGWDEVATLMNKGTILTAFIPSGLAYGPQRRSQQIMENTILAFDMEMQDIQQAPNQ